MTRGGRFMIRKSWQRTDSSGARLRFECKLPALQNEGPRQLWDTLSTSSWRVETAEPAATSYKVKVATKMEKSEKTA